jgi:hypothetical protein
MVEDGVEPKSDEASERSVAQHTETFADRVHSAMSVVLRALGLRPTRPGLYLYSEAGCHGTEKRVYLRRIGDLSGEITWTPVSAYLKSGTGKMWDVRWPSQSKSATEEESPGPREWDPLEFPVRAAEHA